MLLGNSSLQGTTELISELNSYFLYFIVIFTSVTYILFPEPHDLICYVIFDSIDCDL